MKKLVYLFVMAAGMMLASVNANAQDGKVAGAAKKEAKAACCKTGDKAGSCKTGAKETTAACAGKDASMSQNAKEKAGACCKSKSVATASDAKSSKTVN